VVASSDPSLSRTPGSFGPLALESLGAANRTLAWTGPSARGFARWDPVRGDVFALRQPRPAMGEALLALARLVVVGVGLGLVTAVACLLATLGGLRLQLHHKILLSYFVISVIPIVLLGVASARETQARHDARLAERLQTDVGRVRGELELMGAGVFDSADSNKLEEWAPQRRHDVLLYRDGELQAASRTGLVAAELLSRKLPPSAYRATVLERRQIIRREAVYAGRRVWFAYAPVLDTNGRTRATVGVPLLYEADRLEEQVTVTGSVLLAAYMLTLVLVLVGGIYAARRLTRPLATLADGTKQVAAGDLEVELAGEGTDEFGQLVAAFNAMTRDLRRTTERAVRAERESAWRRMASQVAHEIKNPLTPMRLMIQQMEADVRRDPAHAQEAIRRTAPVLLRQIEGLDRIARDFANFARLPKRRTERLDAGALVREVTALHSGAAANGIDVRCDVPEGLPPVWWDEEELRRVLLNVVLNAVESIEGGGEVLLTARPERRGATAGVLVTVRDDGAGIPPENIERLFEPQFSTKTHGTGLGLAIVSRIVQDMGGSVDVESQPGEGTTFRLWWPSREP
jgi:signal transduction histidine kinase